MADDYDAVRYVAYHALLSDERFKDFQFDYMNPVDTSAAEENVGAKWDSQGKEARSANPQLLINAEGSFNYGKTMTLLQGRDNQPVLLNE